MLFATVDIETTGLDRFKDDITWIGVQINEDNTKPTVFTFDYKEKLDRDEFRVLVKSLKERKAKFIWQNGKFDTLFISKNENKATYNGRCYAYGHSLRPCRKTRFKSDGTDVSKGA